MHLLSLTFLLAYATIGWGQTKETNADLSPDDVARLLAAGEVYYRDFGAKGDGQTDDIEAIAAAHAFANENSLVVRADDQATYYIGGKERTVNIQTDTDFGTASFIIDDTNVENREASVFRVSSTLRWSELTAVSALKKNQSKIDVSLSGPSLITAVNANVTHYIREGLNQDQGSAQVDVFLVDQDGNVDLSTPIIWDVDQVTAMYALPIDGPESTLTIRGGRFTTLANRDASEYNYYDRNFEIVRSHVVVDGIEHYVEGEGEQGAPYGGFIDIQNCAYVTVKNALLTGRKTYYTTGSTGQSVAMGSYDISLYRALNVSFVNCRQSNDINDRQYWSIMGSNYCKNLLYDRCELSRFDAHRGTNNATIRNSTLGHRGVGVVGSGTLTIENTTIRANHIIELRSDYGSSWQGEVVIRDCTFAPDASRTDRVELIYGRYSGKHDFGYPCYLPERITIENLQIDDADYPEDYPGPVILANFNSELTDESYQEDFPYLRTGEVMLSGVTIESGKALRLSDNPFLFKDVKVIEQPEPDQGNTVTVRAQGSTGEEQVVLLADGVAQGEAAALSTTMSHYSWDVEFPFTDLSVAFVNDGNSAAGADKNVRVDYLVVGADTLQAEDQLTNTGSWSVRGGCGSGGASEWLYCEGYIAFAQPAEQSNATTYTTTWATGEERLYPNPAESEVVIKGPEHYRVQVYDLEGRLLDAAEGLANRSQLDINRLRPGVYLLRLTNTDTGQTHQQRLVVE